MNRRNFLEKSITAASTVTLMTACGGGGGGDSQQAPDGSVNTTSTSTVDTKVASLQSSKSYSDSLHSNSMNNIAVSTGVSSVAARFLASSSPATTANYFTSKTPELPTNSILTSMFLEGDENKNMWEKYQSYNNLSYQQFTHQYDKLMAAMRLFDYKKSQLPATAPAQKSVSFSAGINATQSNAAQSNASYSIVSSIFGLALASLMENFGSVTIDIITTALVEASENIDNSEGAESIFLTTATLLTVNEVLDIVKEKLLEDLNFSNRDDIMISLSKMSIAIIALTGKDEIEERGSRYRRSSPSYASASESESEMTEEELEAYISAISIQSKLTLILMELMQDYVNSTNTDIQETITELTSRPIDGSNDTAFTPEEDAKRLALQEKLKKQSTVMTTVAVVMKSLFALLSQDALDENGDQIAKGFSPNGDAKKFWMLFGNESLPQDEAFMKYSSEVQTSIEDKIILDETNEAPNALSGIFDLLKDMNTNFSSTNKDYVAQTGNQAFSFAALLAGLSYQFTADTETDAYNFAVHMSQLAYDFTMNIEEDAYQFAMQGMEYGYLFASRGEEVGIMADRVLWMAVQIGQMSDRIGEMADRIVYTEQLIVYTEMLILDFGLLIYGGMKMITNTMLMGMAIIFDREWYTPTAEDQVLTVIGGNVSQMMENMQEYALAMLDNQSVLREITLSAMDWVDTPPAT